MSQTVLYNIIHPWNEDTPVIRTLIFVPGVSRIERFHYTYNYKTQIWNLFLLNNYYMYCTMCNYVSVSLCLFQLLIQVSSSSLSCVSISIFLITCSCCCFISSELRILSTSSSNTSNGISRSHNSKSFLFNALLTFIQSS